MDNPGFGSGTEYLRAPLINYINRIYENPVIHHDEEVDQKLEWKPSIHFTINDCVTVFVEISDTPYPRIFRMRHAEVLDVRMPIAIYSVCPEDAYTRDQKNSKKLNQHGYGLFTVDDDQVVHRVYSCNPLIQRISQEEFVNETRQLPKKIRQRLREAFDKYEHNAPSGVTDISEVVEGIVIKAATEATKKNFLKSSILKLGVANILDQMYSSSNFKNVQAEIGGVRGYIKEYRNLSHHFPKSKAQAYKRYADCRHGFVDGLKRIDGFRKAMKSIGLTGGI